MSQSQAPSIDCKNFSNTAGWRDLDFYRIKLVCDRVDGIGFWYYLCHLMEAWRDFTLWLKFGKLVQNKPKARQRAECKFKHKKTPAKVEKNKDEAETREEFKKVVLPEKPIDEKDKK